MNIYQHIQSVARQQGSRDAFSLPGVDSSLSFQELDSRTAQLASVLISKGLAPGQRVVVQLPKSTDVVLLYLAALRSGAVYVPLNTGYTASELGYFIEDCKPGMVFLDQSKGGAEDAGIPGVEDRLQNLAELLRESLEHDPNQAVVPRASTDPAAIVYTSGTTGRSKGAMLSHANLISNARSLIDLWGFSTEDRLLHALPIYHVHGLFVALHCALLSGCSTRFLAGFDVNTVVDELATGCTVMMGVPTFYTRLLKHPEFPRDQQSMRLYISGSAPLLPETFHEFEKRTGHQILERYGMTEAGMISSNPLVGERIPGTVGYALPGVQMRIRTASGALAAASMPGVLEIKGPNVFCGYWQNPEKTDESFTPDGYFITGDVARLDEQGRLTIVGREKDLIISGGLNVYPIEIEQEIDKFPGIEESAVIGVPHSDFGEAVVAVLVGQIDPEAEVQLREQLKGNLAGFKVPKAFHYLNALPRNSMGKVQKSVLRERFSETFVDAG